MINPNATATNLSYSIARKFISGGLGFFKHVDIRELLLAVVIFISISSLRQKKHCGLPVWPVVGMLPSLAIGLISENAYEWLTDVLRNQNGTFHFRGPFRCTLNAVVTSDPRNMEHLLKTNFHNFPKGPHFRDTLHDLLGSGIFNADGETWQRQRKTASIEFHSAKFRQLTTESLVELVHHRLLPVLEAAVKSTSPVDLQDILLRLTFDNVCMIAFGVDPGCLRPELPEIPFAKAFEDATEASLLHFIKPMFFWKAMRFFDLGAEKLLRRSIKEVDGFADEVIRTRR